MKVVTVCEIMFELNLSWELWGILRKFITLLYIYIYTIYFIYCFWTVLTQECKRVARLANFKIRLKLKKSKPHIFHISYESIQIVVTEIIIHKL